MVCNEERFMVKNVDFFDNNETNINGFVNFFRYFGTAEGSKFVELNSINNIKRTWVNYGLSRDWSTAEQGQVCVNIVAIM